MNVNTLYVDVFLFNVVITLYSFFFSESSISMIRSKSSSLLNGILFLWLCMKAVLLNRRIRRDGFAAKCIPRIVWNLLV